MQVKPATKHLTAMAVKVMIGCIKLYSDKQEQQPERIQPTSSAASISVPGILHSFIGVLFFVF